MKLHSLLPLLGAVAVLAMVQTPLMAQPFPAPFSYDFEAEPTCSTSPTVACPLVGPFTNLTDDNIDWTVDVGGTSSSVTGPSVDHNPGTSAGKYLYTESSATGGNPNMTAKLLSPLLDLTGVANPTVTFWYHMYGATMGTMHLDFVEPIQTGTDGITTTGATFTTAGPSAAFVPGHVGTQITISGSTMGNDGVYTIMTVLGPNAVDVMPPFVVAEAGLTYNHEAITLDVIPSWTDNQDLWQKRQLTVTGLIQFGGTTFQVIIRGITGTSFTSDMAIDDFSYIDLIPNDVGVVSVDAPAGFINPAGMYPVTVTVENFGSATQTSIPVNYTIDGGTPVTETYMGSIASGATDTFTFMAPANLSTPGYFTIAAYTTLAGDTNTPNDGTSALVGTLPTTPISSFPYMEDFEANPGFWAPGGTNSSWAYGTPAKPVINSAASGANCWVTGGLAGQYPNNENSYLQSPPFDFTSLSAPLITFNIWWESEFSWDGAVLQSSIDGGMSWQNVGMFGDPNNWYTDTTISGLSWTGLQEGWTGRTTSSNGSGMWVPALHELTGLGGQPNVLLRFAFGSDGSVQWEGIAFDDIVIDQAFIPYPGTVGGDVLLGTGVNAAPSSGLNQFVKTATGLDAINLLVSSPMGLYDFQPYVLLTQPFVTGTPPTPTIPGLVWLDLNSPFVILVNIDPFLTQVLDPGGSTYGLTMPLGFAGQSFLFQAACVTPALSVSDGYEIQVQ